MVKLNANQKAVLCRVCNSNKDIAKDLTMQLCTIKTYIKQLFDKFQATSRCELLLRALETKTITLDEIILKGE